MNIRTILEKLVSMPTVTGQLPANNTALDFIAGFLRDRGMHITRAEYETYGTLVATTRATKTPRVMLVGHIDVVPAAEHMFAVHEQDGKLIGRGVLDMKSAIASYMMAVDQLKDTLNAYDFGIMVSSDEETVDRGIKYLIADGYCPTEAAVLFDGGYDWQIEKAAKGALCGKIAIAGKTGHGSRPWLVNSATTRLVALLNDLHDAFPSPSPITNTLNISAIAAGNVGEAINQIPDTASATIDIRTINQTEARKLRAHVKALCEKYDATFAELVSFKALLHNLQSPHRLAFSQHIQRVTGITNEGVVSSGASDAGHFLDKGVDCIVTWPIGGNHHSNNEWIDIQALNDMTPILVGYLCDMAQSKTPALVEQCTAKR